MATRKEIEAVVAHTAGVDTGACFPLSREQLRILRDAAQAHLATLPKTEQRWYVWWQRNSAEADFATFPTRSSAEGARDRHAGYGYQHVHVTGPHEVGI